MISFDEWYHMQTGINTNDLTDDQYEELWADEELMGCYEAEMVWARHYEDGGDK